MSELPDGWEERPYDEDIDEAPPFYNDPDHDCDGTEGSEHEGDDEHNEHKTIRGGAGTAADRGWGPGWPNCQSGHIVTIIRADGIKLPVHRDLKVLIALLCDETERRGYNLVPGWCWGFACRAIRGSSSPSNHSWGLAVDLNAPTNPMTSPLKTDMPGWMPELWNSYGFRWGGDYSGRKDAMHYEFMGSPADARGMTKKALWTLGGDELTPEQEAKIDKLLALMEAMADGLFAKDNAVAKAASGRGYSVINGLESLKHKLNAIAP